MTQSPQFHLSEEDWQKWSKNIGIFSAPLVIAYLTALSQGVPMQQALLFVYAAAINALIDLIRKWNEGQNVAKNLESMPAPTPPEPLG